MAAEGQHRKANQYLIATWAGQSRLRAAGRGRSKRAGYNLYPCLYPRSAKPGPIAIPNTSARRAEPGRYCADRHIAVRSPGSVPQMFRWV